MHNKYWASFCDLDTLGRMILRELSNAGFGIIGTKTYNSATTREGGEKSSHDFAT